MKTPPLAIILAHRPTPRFTVARIGWRPRVYALFDNATHDHRTGLHRKAAGKLARTLNRRIIRHTWQPWSAGRAA